MAGYLNRFIDLGFPDLAGVDEVSGRALCWVKIRNPRLIPGENLLGGATVQVGDDGRPVDSGAAARETFTMFSKLIIAGNVWDAKWLPALNPDGSPVDPDEEPPLLPMPPSPDDVGRMPIEILNGIGEELSKAVPR